MACQVNCMPRIKKLDNKDYKTVIDACRKDLSDRLENNVPMYSGACKQGIELIAALKRKLDI